MSFSIKLQEINLYACKAYKTECEAQDPNRTERKARRSNISERKARRPNISEHDEDVPTKRADSFYY